MKKSRIIQELVNVYPPWAKVRQSDQALGFQFLNAIAQRMEYMQKELKRMQSNYYASTINLDEIDLTYKVSLPTTFSFSEDDTDPLFPSPDVPTISGLVGSTWYDISLALNNSLENFWYKSTPNRVTLNSSVSGEDHTFVIDSGMQYPKSGVWEHHLGGGHLWVECSGGTEYITLSNGKLLRGRVILKGETRKGTIESETLVFPWDMKQRTIKEWKKLTDIQVFNIEEDTIISVKSADFGGEPYQSFYNFRHSPNRRKIDELWELDELSALVTGGIGTTLNLVEYISDEWEQLIAGLTDRQVIRSWELLDNSSTYVSGVDMAMQPFTDNLWVATADGYLHCYDITETMPSGLSRVRDKTFGSDVQIELDKNSVVIGETITFIPWHARPIKEIRKYRIWYQEPSGTKYGLLDGSPVSFTSNFWVTGTGTISRSIENVISITATERGEYTIALEALFVDETTHTDKILVPVEFKIPKVSLDISSIVPETVSGIDFDSDQKLWVACPSGYYCINLHSDTMLIDYTNKEIYFRENYSEVEVIV